MQAISTKLTDQPIQNNLIVDTLLNSSCVPYICFHAYFCQFLAHVNYTHFEHFNACIFFFFFLFLFFFQKSHLCLNKFLLANKSVLNFTPMYTFMLLLVLQCNCASIFVELWVTIAIVRFLDLFGLAAKIIQASQRKGARVIHLSYRLNRFMGCQVWSWKL